MERQTSDIVNLETELDDPTVDEQRVKTIFSRMKSVLHLSENEIAGLNCELSKIKQERDSLLDKLQNKDVQLATYEQRAPINNNRGNRSHRDTSLNGDENEDVVTTKTRERDRIESERLQLKYQLEAKENELEQWKLNYNDIRSSRDELQTKLGKREEELAALDKNYVSLQIQIERKENKIQVLESRLNERSPAAGHDGDNNHRREEDKYMRDLMKMLEDTAKDRERQVEKANDELKRANSDLSVLKEKHIVLEQEYKTTKTGMEQLETKFHGATNEVNQLQNDKTNLSNQLQTVTTDLQNTRATLQSVEENLMASRKKSNELEEIKIHLLQEFDEWRQNEHNRFQNMQNDHHKVKRELEKAAAVKEDIHLQLQQSNCRNTEVEMTLRGREDIIKNLNEELNKLRCQLESERNKEIDNEKKQETYREQKIVELCQVNEKLAKEKKVLKRKQLELKQRQEETKREVESLVNGKEDMKKLLNNYMHDLEEKKKIIQSKTESEASYEKRLSVLKVEINKVTENWKGALAEKEETQESLRLTKVKKSKLNEALIATKSRLKETELQLHAAEEFLSKRQGMKESATLDDGASREGIEKLHLLEKTVLEKENIISDQAAKLKACGKETAELKSSNETKDETIRINSSQICELQNQIEELETKLMNELALTNDLRACLEEKSKECEMEASKMLALMKTNEETKQKCEQFEKALEVQIGDNRNLTSKLSDVRDQLTSANKSNDLLQSTKQTTEKEIEHIRCQLEAAESNIMFMRKCESDAAKRQDELMKDLLEEVAKKEDCIKENGVLSTELADTKVHLSSLQEKLLASQAETREKTKKIKRLKKLMRNEPKAAEVVQGEELGHKSDELQMTCQTGQMFDDLLQKHQSLLEENQLLNEDKENTEKREEHLKSLIRDSEKNADDAKNELQELNEKYQQLLRDALALKSERDQLSDSVQNLTDNSKTSLERVKELQGQLIEAGNKLHEKVAANESLSKDVSKGQDAISDLKKILEEKDLLIVTYKRTNEELRKASETDKLQYHENVKRLDRAMTKHKEEALLLTSTLNKMQQNLNNYEGNISDLTLANRAVVSREQCLAEGRKCLKLRINELETVNEGNQQKICTLTEALKAVETSHERVKKEHKDVKTLLDVSETEVKRMTMVHESAESKIALLETSYDASRQEIVILEQERTALKSEIENLRTRSTDMRKKIKALQKKNKCDQRPYSATMKEGEYKGKAAKQLGSNSASSEQEQVIRAAVIVLRKLKAFLEREGDTEHAGDFDQNTSVEQPTNATSCTSTIRNQYLNIAEALSKVLNNSKRRCHEEENG